MRTACPDNDLVRGYQQAAAAAAFLDALADICTAHKLQTQDGTDECAANWRYHDARCSTKITKNTYTYIQTYIKYLQKTTAAL